MYDAWYVGTCVRAYVRYVRTYVRTYVGTYLRTYVRKHQWLWMVNLCALGENFGRWQLRTYVRTYFKTRNRSGRCLKRGRMGPPIIATPVWSKGLSFIMTPKILSAPHRDVQYARKPEKLVLLKKYRSYPLKFVIFRARYFETHDAMVSSDVVFLGLL